MLRRFVRAQASSAEHVRGGDSMDEHVADDVVDELVTMLHRVFNMAELHYVAGSDDMTEQVLEDARLLLGRHGVEV